MSKTKWIIAVSLILFFLFISFIFVDQSAERVTQLKNAITTTHKMHTDLLMLRRNEKDFLARFDMAYVDRFANNHAILKSDVIKIKTYLENSDIIEQLSDFEIAIEEYYDAFKRLVRLQTYIGLGPYQGYYGKLRDDAHKIEKILNNYDSPELTNLLLMLRRKEKDFMLRNLEQYIKQFEEYSKLMTTKVDLSSIEPIHKKRIIEALESYQKNFIAYSEGIIKKGLNNHDGLLGETTQKAHVLDRYLAQLQHQLLDESMSLEIRTNRHTRLLMLIFVVGVLSIALIPFFFFIFNVNRKTSSLAM